MKCGLLVIRRALEGFVVLFLPFLGYAQIGADDTGNFVKADSVAALYPHHSIADLKGLSEKLTKPLSGEATKFRAIYKWVCNNIQNDYWFYVKNKYKREKLQGNPEELALWNKRMNSYFFKALLMDHKTICTGYAYLIRELASHAGLNCKIIDGYGRTAESNIGGSGIANHSWNAVQLDNKWYLCDATWSSGSVVPKHGLFIKDFSEAYFLTPPSFFVLNHYPLDTSWTLLKDKPSLQEFLNAPLVYKHAFKYEVRPTFPHTFNSTAAKGNVITFRFAKESKHAMEKIELQINYNDMSQLKQVNIYQESEKEFAFDYVFPSKGKHVAHLIINGNYIFSHEVTVE